MSGKNPFRSLIPKVFCGGAGSCLQELARDPGLITGINPAAVPVWHIPTDTETARNSRHWENREEPRPKGSLILCFVGAGKVIPGGDNRAGRDGNGQGW